MIELRGLNQEQITSMIPATPIIVGYRGSIAHGMYVPSSDPSSIDDKDLMSVCIPPLSYYFGFENHGFGDRGVKEKAIAEWDSVAYELKKFVSLLVKSNPNVLSLLWLEPNYYVHVSPEGRTLIDGRRMFVSKKIYHAFTGYAYGQLHRMQHQAFEGYMGEKRKQLVEKHGYDTKNAAHCIRLLRLGIEFLNEGTLYVDRSKKDGPELLAIKRGEWTLNKVKSEAERLFKRAEEVYDQSQLPAEPNKDQVNELLMQILKPHFFCEWRRMDAE
jgi:predicted nucleotidyltransferase